MADLEELERVMDNAHKKLQGLAAGGVSGGNLGLRNNSERLYGLAYQGLVKAGARGQIKRKYRG